MNNKYYTFNKLNEFNDIVHLYTKIPYNFSRKYVIEEEINREIKEIEKDFNIEIKSLKYMKQVHDKNIMIVNEDNIDIDCYEGYDGMLTNLKGIALSTISADCQSIFLYDNKKKVIGNVHSGWKGTLKRILREAISKMEEVYDSNKEDIIVCINPSIHKCCFEVEQDVIDMFNNEFKDIDKYIEVGNIVNGIQKYYIDTIGINLKELDELGINKDNIFVSEDCTKCNSNIYHSYRVEGIGTGQNLAVIMIKE